MRLDISENMALLPKVSVSNMSSNSKGRKILIIIVIFSLTVGFGGGFWFANYQATNSLPIIRELINKNLGQSSEVDFGLFWEVWNKMSEKYVDPAKLDIQKMTYGAIEGMVNSVGDPYTVFLEPPT